MSAATRATREIVHVTTTSRAYDVHVGEDLLRHTGKLIRKAVDADKAFVVTDTNVAPPYLERIKASLAAAGFSVSYAVVEAGEQHKTLQTYGSILERMATANLTRDSIVVALGGGVVGDMAGFAAATYMRGIRVVQVPTTLLSMVDSSVGGKVAVNHRLGKNMIGAFYQPKLVLTDINTLKTLDDRQFKTGLSEVIKYAFIEKSCGAEADYNFLEFLEQNKISIINKEEETISRLIQICCELKSAVVNQDEKEKGLRAILNFGHTFAHAIENITEYKKYTHGEAVSIGMQKIFNLAFALGFISEEYYKRAEQLLQGYSLVTELDFKPDKENFYNIMTSDKKVSDSKINFVMPYGEKLVRIENNIDKNIVIQGI